MKIMPKHSLNLRVYLFLGVVILVSSLILYRLFILSVIRHSTYLRTAQAQSENVSNILARGNIYLSDGNSDPIIAATNKKFPLVYIIPADIKREESSSITEKISSILNIDPESIKEKINSGSKSLRVIKRRISEGDVLAIKDINIKGVGVKYETDRYYPMGSLASDVVGFLGYDSEGKKAGQYGSEAYYDNELFGKEPTFTNLFSAINPSKVVKLIRKIKGENIDKDETEQEFDRPANVVLSIDKNVQTFAENELRLIMEKWGAEKGTIIVEDPETGRILAMADLPSFDPNNYSEYESKLYLNGSIQEIYEPGSSFKPVTMSAGIDLGKITPGTTYEDKGFVNISGYTIHNFSNKVFGVQSMTQVLEKSINTGTMFVENLVGDDDFMNYVINMGFGQKTGIDLSGEISGDINNLYSGRKVNFLTASFGQGIAVTPLQLINAYAVIANGGKLMRPHVVDKILKEGGVEEITKPEIISIPISEKTAVKLQSMLVGVVDNGFDKARIKGYDIAGKTGTAQIPGEGGGYLEGQFIHNFVGFAPAYNAKFVILIKIDKPKGITFASDSLSPSFKNIAAFLLNYYNVPPTRK